MNEWHNINKQKFCYKEVTTLLLGAGLLISKSYIIQYDLFPGKHLDYGLNYQEHPSSLKWIVFHHHSLPFHFWTQCKVLVITLKASSIWRLEYLQSTKRAFSFIQAQSVPSILTTWNTQLQPHHTGKCFSSPRLKRQIFLAEKMGCSEFVQERRAMLYKYAHNKETVLELLK